MVTGRPVVRSRAPRSAVFVARSSKGSKGSKGGKVPQEGRDGTGLSSLRLGKPSESEMQQLAVEFSRRTPNHEFVGASEYAPDLPDEVKQGGFMITKSRAKVGEGRKAFDAAVAAIKKWQHLQLGWNETTKPSMAAGTKICSITQTVVPWSVLPAEVAYMKEGGYEFKPKDKGRRFALGLNSLTGHQLAGEERFAVELHADGSVWYDVFLFSRPDTLLALASLPVVKIMQLRYVNDSVKAMKGALEA